MEKLFKVLDVMEEQKVSLAVFMFTEEAAHWWQVKKDLLSTPTTWDIFMDPFYENFFPAYVRNEKNEEFIELQ